VLHCKFRERFAAAHPLQGLTQLGFAARIFAMRFATGTCVALTLWACSPAPSLPAKAPTPLSTTAPPSSWKQVEQGKQKVPLVPEPQGVPAPDAACQAFLSHPTLGCGKAGAEREALAQALGVSDPLERDAALSCLEENSAFAPGLLRALRAELAPLGCADVLALPFLEPRRAELERSVEDTLIALAAGGRLSRLVQKAPELAPPFDRAHFMEFFQGTFKPWIVSQAAAIHDLAQPGPALSPYAKGVIGIEAGLADMRFVSVARQIALPKDMNDDAEVREAYYAALDEALEPRKARGRDAALVGLRQLANGGVLVDPRVERARALLSQVYSGRRIDALDQLLLPEQKPAQLDTTDRLIAARLPTFYANFLLAGAAIDAPLLRALLERGMPHSIAAQLNAQALDEPSRDLLIRLTFEHGRRYFHLDDFATSEKLSLGGAASPDRSLYRALAAALKNGPRDATELLLRGPALPTGAAEVKELDRLAAEKGNPNAPLAAFDAAYLLSLVPPQNDAKFWDDLAARFQRAQGLLKEPRHKQLARASGNAAKDTARALRDQKPAAPPK